MCRPLGRVVIRPPPNSVPFVRPTPKPESEGPVPLQSVSVSVDILDFTARVNLSQKFKNIENNPIEAVYQFPLNEKHTICDFTAIIDGKVVKGECQEKEEAKNTYDDSIATGGGAYLLEKSEDDPNIFTVNVGNLPPQKEVDIQITYVYELDFTPDGQLQFILSSAKSGKSSATAKKIPLSLKVNLDMTSNIRSISSPSHPISFEFGDKTSQATVTLAAEGQDQGEKDFILNTKLAQPHQPCGRIQKDKSGNLAAMVALYPNLELADDEDIYTEMIFVVDRSGSMAGSRINQVKDTLLIFLRSLGEGTMFNIVGFGTRCEFLFKGGSVEYNEKNLDIATKHVKELKANLGGTNILKPLQEILTAKTVEGYPRQLFVLTDGEVSNTSECVDFVRKHADTTRVFTFGIGNEASQDLVKGMAKAAEGFFEFVVSGESMEDKVMKQLNRAMQPALTDITIDWGKLQAQQSPYRLPPLFVGGRMVVYAFITSSSTGEFEVKLKAKTAVKAIEQIVKLNIDKADTNDLIHKVSTRSMIKDLEEKRSYLHTREGSLVSGKSEQDIKSEIVRLSTSYGVLSKHTAFVAIEERSEATEGTMQLRKCGVSLEKQTPVPAQPVFNSNLLLHSIVGPPRSATSGRGGARPPGAAPGNSAMPPLGSRSSSMAPPAPRSSSLAPPAPGNSFSLSQQQQQQQPVQLQSRERSSGPAEKKKKGGGFFSFGKTAAAPAALRKKSKQKECSSSKPPTLVSSSSRSSSFSSSFSLPPPAPSACAETNSRADRADLDDLLCVVNQDSANFADFDEAEETVQAIKAPPPAQLKNIILQQKASGSWFWKDVGSMLGSLTEAKIKSGIPKLSVSVTPDIETVWITAVVAAYLAKVYSSEENNWLQVVKKAFRFIAKQKKALNIQPDLDWKQLATEFVASNA